VHTGRDGAVFVRAALDLPVPLDRASGRLHGVLAAERLQLVSDRAYSAGLVTLVHVGPFGELAGLSKTVRLEVLEPRPIEDGLRVPLRWMATGPAGRWFPALDADLDLTAVDEGASTLSINAVYDPPLGAFGAGIDRLVLHRAARATMRALLQDLGDRLTDPAPKSALRQDRGRAVRVRFVPATES
jgi:hypothetical protein